MTRYALQVHYLPRSVIFSGKSTRQALARRIPKTNQVQATSYRQYMQRKLGFRGHIVQRHYIPKTLQTGWGSNVFVWKSILYWMNQSLLPPIWAQLEHRYKASRWTYLQLIKYYERAGYACNLKLERRLTTGFFNWRNKLIDSQRWYRHQNPKIRNYKHTIAVIHDKYIWSRHAPARRCLSPYKIYTNKKFNQHFYYYRNLQKFGIPTPFQPQKIINKKNSQCKHEGIDSSRKWIVRRGQLFNYRRKGNVPVYFGYCYNVISWRWARIKREFGWYQQSRYARTALQKPNIRQLKRMYSKFTQYRNLKMQVTQFLQQKEELRLQGLVYGQPPYFAVQKTRKSTDFVSEYKQGLYRLALNYQRVWHRPINWSKPKPWIFHWTPIDEIFQQYTNEIFELDKQKQKQFLDKRRSWTPIWQFMARGYRVGDIAHRWPSEFPKRSYFYRPIWRRPFAFIEYREWKRHVYYHRHVWTRFMRCKKYDWKTKYGGVFLRRWNYEYGLYQGQALLMDQFTGIPGHDVLLDQQLWGAQTAKAGFKTVGSQSQRSWRWAHPRNLWFSGPQTVPGYFGHLRFHKIFFKTYSWEPYAKRISIFRSVCKQTNGNRWILSKYEKAYRDKLLAQANYLTIEQALQLSVNQQTKLQAFYQAESLINVKNCKNGLTIPFIKNERTACVSYPLETKQLHWYKAKSTQLQRNSENWQAGTWCNVVFMALGIETLYVYRVEENDQQQYYIGDRGELTARRWAQEYQAKKWKDLGRLQIPQELLRLQAAVATKKYSVNWEQVMPQQTMDPTARRVHDITYQTRLNKLLFSEVQTTYLRLLEWDACSGTPISNLEHRARPCDDIKIYNLYNERLPVSKWTFLFHSDKQHYGEFVINPSALNYGSWSESRLTTARATYWNSATKLKRAIMLSFLVSSDKPFWLFYFYLRRQLWLRSLIPPEFDDPHWHSPIQWKTKHFPENFTWQRYLYIQVKHRLLDLQPGHVKRIINLYPIYWQNFFSKPRGIYRICPWGVHKEWPVRTQTNYTRGARYEPIMDFWQYSIHFCAREVIAYLMWCHERLPRYPTGTRNRGMLPVRHEVYWHKVLLHLRKYKIPALIDEDLPPWVPWGLIFYSGGIKNWVIVGQETMQPGWICLKNYAFIEFGIQHGLIYAGTYGRHYAPMVYAGFVHGFVVGITALRSHRARWWADYEVHLIYTKFHRKYSQHFRAQFFETDMPETGSFGSAKRWSAWHSWLPIFGSRIRYWNFLAQCMDQGGWEPSCVWGRTRAHYDLIYWKIVDNITHGGYGIEIPQYSYRFDSAQKERVFFEEKLVNGQLNSRGLILCNSITKNQHHVQAKSYLNQLKYQQNLSYSTTRIGYAGNWVRSARYYRWRVHYNSIFELNQVSETRRKEKFPRYQKSFPKLTYQTTKSRLRHRFRHLTPVDYNRAKKIFIRCLDSPKVWAGIEIWFSEWFNESLFDYQIDRVVERLKPFVERQRDPTRGMYEYNPHYWMCHHSGRATDEFTDQVYWKEEFYQSIRLVLFLHVAEGYRKLYTGTRKKSFPNETLAAADAHIFGRDAIKSSAMWIGLLLGEAKSKALLRVHENQWYWRRKHFISLLGRLVYGKEPRIHRSEATDCSDWEFLFENFDRWYKRDLDWKRDQEYRRINHNFPYQHVRHYKRTLRKKINKWA